MNNSIADETLNSPTGAVLQPRAAKKASRAPQRAHVSKNKARSAKKASSTKKSLKNATQAMSARKGSKTDKVLALLKRPGGATTNELIKATGWQAHSVRGFLSGTVGKKMGLTIISMKGEDGERNYKIKA